MSNRPYRDWGSIADWISVLLQIFTPMFTLLVGVLFVKQSHWTGFVVAVLAFALSFGIILVLVSIRTLPFGALFTALKERVLAESPQGFAIRLLLSLILGAVVLLALSPFGGQTENGWIAMGTLVATWLGLSVASSNATLRQLRADYSTLRDIAGKITDLETRVLSYPDGDSDWT